MSILMDDTLAGLLDGPRARGAFLLRSILTPPWSLRIEDRAPLSLVTMVRGRAWITSAEGDPVAVEPGEIAIVRGPTPYTVADEPDTPVQVTVGPGQVCTTVEGVDVGESRLLGVRTWGPDPGGSTVMLSGTYQLQREVGQRLIGALPPVLVRPVDAEDAALVSLLEAEVGKDKPGQELVLDRLLDLVLVSVLRAWLASPGTGSPGWYRAQHDPVVGEALRLLHADPAEAWTVATLAARCRVSRAALARRFTALVGEPPMNYLTSLRLALAADLLRETDATLGSAARQVGYGSAFALSSAFKRVRGMSPREYLRQAVPAR
ncbi:AraC family transcriptional regulator [Actinokineospora sp. UTMC 2448]|uniref:AraC family transcriptional regulator n=1 Tax=Actinokineospora sp. UTMC 2448 TaxID=2268449 RepID=UPI002164B0D6|nr:AraC family transcriptional regulator [Actinokineospora sp. UTMC 2448]UVS80433.1 transcriptional activator FtrA [Actinokineospora sp. UTMC 2448]